MLSGLWTTDALDSSGMEAATLSFGPDGGGWYALERPGSAEYERFTWHRPTPNLLVLNQDLYFLVIDGRVAESRPQTGFWRSRYAIGSAPTALGDPAGLLTFDHPLGPDRHFARTGVAAPPLIDVRPVRHADLPVVWTLATLPNIGRTADPSRPLALTPAERAPESFTDLADPDGRFDGFVVATFAGHVVGCGGLRVDPGGATAEILRVRVHPATRRVGVGRAVMAALERRAADLGCRRTRLDTATNQPEAIGFYRGLGYAETGREEFDHWTLVYFERRLDRDRAEPSR